MENVALTKRKRTTLIFKKTRNASDWLGAEIPGLLAYALKAV